MGRVHLIEIEDQSWCPQALRDGITDILRFNLNVGKYYSTISKKLEAAIQNTQTDNVIDLCSGGGGPWISLLPELSRNQPLTLHLTDKYPNVESLQDLKETFGDKVEIHTDSNDATDMPENLTGFRTMFTSFHHFRPEQASKILRNAVDHNQGIGIFEFTQRSTLALVLMLLAPIAALLVVPFAKPFRWSRIFLTYLVPVLPLMSLFDGIVSCLRTYSPSELQELVNNLNANHYEWEIGEAKGGALPTPITYLIGYPKNTQNISIADHG